MGSGIVKKITDKQAVKAAKILSKYCRQRADECDKCIFYPLLYDNKCFCEMNFHVEPELWGTKELKRELKK